VTSADKFAEALAPQPKPLYRILSGLQYAMTNCKATRNREWLHRHGQRYFSYVKTYLDTPDIECITLQASSAEHLKFDVRYERNGVTYHYNASVKPSLFFGFRLYVRGGRNSRDGNNDYLHEVLEQRLAQVVPDV
jgi:hypothetical protein